MAQTAERRIHGTDHEFDVQSLKRQHLRVAKRLRDYWVARIQITETHSLELAIADWRLPIGFRFHVAIEMVQQRSTRNVPKNRFVWIQRWMLCVRCSRISAPTKTARLCRDPSQNPAPANPLCLA